jgi:oligopeptidase A
MNSVQDSRSSNPLFALGFDIPFDQIQPQHIEPAIDHLIEQAARAIAQITEQAQPTFENTLLALDSATEQLMHSYILSRHLEAVVMTPELRSANKAMLPKFTRFMTSLALNPALWAVVQNYAQTPEALALTGSPKRLLEQTLRSFRNNGANLEPAQKQRFSEISERLAQITSSFAQNVLDSTAAWEMLFEDAAPLAGLPESALNAARASAEAKGHSGYRLTLQATSFNAVMDYLDDRNLRQHIWEAQHRNATQAPFDNMPLIAEIVALRHEKAQLLGFATYADWLLEDRMAQSGDKAWDFVRDLQTRVTPFFESESQSLQNFALERGFTEALMPWDISYWAERQRKAEFDFDEELLRPYFSMPKVLAGMFEIVRRVFGIQVSEKTGVVGWHPEVQFYEIYSATGQHLASFYTDWFPRDSKRSGAWMNGLLVGDRSNGKLEPHLALMCGNLTAPVGDTPALLTHREVETVFHEFGHVLHHALSHTEIKSQAGTHVAWDFVELPSQIMENWCWEQASLELFARHYQTDQPIPAELFAKLTKAKNHFGANMFMRQLSLGTVDLSLHAVTNLPENISLTDYARNMMQPFHSNPLPQTFNRIASFTHLFSSPTGYAAGYYSYKWAEVLEADAFTRFRSEGLLSREVGQHFVDSILSQGSSQDPAQLFRNFMHRDPDPSALLERSGLVALT